MGRLIDIGLRGGCRICIRVGHRAGVLIAFGSDAPVIDLILADVYAAGALVEGMGG